MANKRLDIDIETKGDDRGAKKVDQALERTAKRSERLKAVFSGLGALGQKVFSALRIAAVGAAGGIALAIRESVTFNIQMARAWTMMASKGLPAFTAMRREIMGLAGDFGLAKSELAGGLYQALSKGVPENNVISFLSTASKIAVADGTSVVQVVDGLTTSLNAFKIEASRVDEVADKMMQTVAKGGTTFGEIASSIAGVAPVAAAAGVPLDHILAGIATLTKGGTPTAQAVTQMRAAIVGLNTVMGDGWAKTMSMQEAANLLFKEVGGSQNKLKEMLGSIEAVVGVLGMAGDNAEGAAQDMHAVADGADAVDASFKKVDPFQNWAKLIETALGGLANIGDVLDFTLRPAVQQITADLKAWRDDSEAFAGAEARLVKIRDGITDAWAAVTSGGGQGAALFSGIGDVLLGALQSGGEKAVALLAKAGPLVGDAIGQAAKRAMKGWFEESATRDTAETTVRGQILAEGGREGLKKARASGEYQRRADALIQQVEDFKRDKLQREGVEIAETLPSGDGGARIARGKEKIAGVLEHGGLIRRQRETAQLPERPPAPTPIPQATDTVRPATEVELEAQRRGVSTDSIFQARIRAKSEKAAREKKAAALKAEIAGTISAQQEEEAAFFGDVTKEQGEADTAAAALTRTRAESKGKLGGRTTVARAEETYNKEQADVKEAEAALHAVKSQGLTNLQSLLQIALQMHGDQVNMASEIKTLKSQIANAREGT